MKDSRDINDLHFCVRRGAAEFIARLSSQGYPVGVSSTLRDNEYQAKLYAQGRTTPGAIVTNAKPGYSMHNYGLAFDIFKNIKGQEWSDSVFFDTAGKIGREMGFVWGGDFTGLVDKPHFEYSGGLSITELLAGKSLAADAKMKWENSVATQLSTPQPTARMTRVYNIVDEVPDWGKPTIEKLIAKGLLKGDGIGLDLTHDMARLLTLNDRAGLYG